MKPLFVVGILLTLLALVPAAPASAACYKCSPATGCCVDAPQGSSGKKLCSYSQSCGGGGFCQCFNCSTHGGSCTGTGGGIGDT